MEDKDYIKDLFQEKLANHTEKVDPKVWNAIQSQMGISVAGSAGISVLTKVIIGVLVVGAITTTSILLMNKKTEVENLSQNIENKVYKIEEEIYSDEKIAVNTIVEEEKVKPTTVINSEDTILDINIEKSKENSLTVDTLKNDLSLKTVNDKMIEPTVQKGKKEGVISNKKVKVSLEPIQIIVTKNKTVYSFSLQSSDYEYIEWNFGDNTYSSERNPSHIYTKPGKYIAEVRVIKGDEEQTEQVTIEIVVVGKILKLPSAISVNNDGINDELFIESENLVDFQVTILNQSNEVVYDSPDKDFHWDGKDRNGNFVAAGEYVYIITATDTQGNPINKYQRLSVRR